MTGYHECPIDGCNHSVPPHKPMCAAHWALVPAKIGKRLYAAARGTLEHEEAFQAAVAAVNAAIEARRE